jgi:hypothetical protein
LRSRTRASRFLVVSGVYAAVILFEWKKRMWGSGAAKVVAVEVAPPANMISLALIANSGAIEVRLGRGRRLMGELGFDLHHLRA